MIKNMKYLKYAKLNFQKKKKFLSAEEILVPILINFNEVEIGAILVNHLRNKVPDKDSMAGPGG